MGDKAKYTGKKLDGEDCNSPQMCALRLGEAFTAYLSGDISKEDYDSIKEHGGKLLSSIV